MPQANAVFKHVQHPGTRAQPFLRPAGARAIELLKRLIRKAISQSEGSIKTLEVKLEEAVRTAALAGQAFSIKLSPVDTGRLRQSINEYGIAPAGRLKYTIGTNVSYARDVEFGTKPHMIYPRKKKALAFYWKVLKKTRKRRKK